MTGKHWGKKIESLPVGEEKKQRLRDLWKDVARFGRIYMFLIPAELLAAVIIISVVLWFFNTVWPFWSFIAVGLVTGLAMLISIWRVVVKRDNAAWKIFITAFRQAEKDGERDESRKLH